MFFDRYLILMCGVVLAATLMATAAVTLLPGGTAGEVLREIQASMFQG